jgi:integrase/recombinase XerD
LDEVKRILAQPDITNALGLRDRAMLEVFYATAIRREELARLTYSDINQEHGTAVIRQGKGDKDRVVPVTERALTWVARYVVTGRPKLTRDNDSGYLFVTKNGEYLDGKQSYKIVRSYFDKAGVTKPGGPHLLRHACATHMLENGADVRYVQELLGHARLETTQIYTHVSIGKLKNVHQKAHPLADVETDGSGG